MLAAAAAVVITALVVTIWLLAIASHAKPGTDQANARLDAVRTGLAAGAGAGAAVGLMLAFRRQHHQEIATDLTDRDATERRITELYTKAVEQLGSDKAPVRLGGLYALERLAQDNPAHRQTIVNVICAYLRMPFSVAGPTSYHPEPEATGDPKEGTWPETASRGNGATGWQALYDSGPELQERQVRLTAQRILTEHLRDDRNPDQRSARPPGPRFWPDTELDLAGATLIDFSLYECHVTGADFAGATFSGPAWFRKTTFDGPARFAGATFVGEARFDWTTFTSADFIGATFSGEATFDKATFSELATFGETTFGGYVRFSDATFSMLAGFDETTFGGQAGFERATLKFAMFRKATFTGTARFDEANFPGLASFEEATFSREGSFSFRRSQVLKPDPRDVWPTGWCLGADGIGGYTVIRADDGGRS